MPRRTTERPIATHGTAFPETTRTGSINMTLAAYEQPREKEQQ